MADFNEKQFTEELAELCDKYNLITGLIIYSDGKVIASSFFYKDEDDFSYFIIKGINKAVNASLKEFSKEVKNTSND